MSTDPARAPQDARQTRDARRTRDVARPALDPAALRREVTGGGHLWTAVEVVAQTSTTNADLVAAARAGAPEGLVRVAEHQHAGRGRAGRRWSSPPRAGLTVSLLLRPGAAGRWPGPVPPARWGWLPMLTGVALAEAVARVAGLTAALKWPNDLLVGGGKAAGILAEVTGEAVVVGVGLNVSVGPDELPEPSADGPPPTSLALAGAGPAGTDREALLVALLAAAGSWYERFRRAGGDPGGCGLRAAYLERCDTVGRRVRALLPGGGKIAGEATGVDDEARLVVREASGNRRAVAAGDVVHLRGASGAYASLR